MIFIPQGIGQKRFPAEQRMLLNTPDRERGVRDEGAALGEKKKRGKTLTESKRGPSMLRSREIRRRERILESATESER